MSGFLLAVDYGTLHTVAVLRRPDGQVRPLLFGGSPLLPSAVCLGPDGRLLIGRDAESAGRVDPASFVPDPRSRIDAGTVTVGRSTFAVVEVIGRLLALVAREAIRSAGGVLPRLVLTHPASWDETRRATLTEAAYRAGLGVPTLVPTPVAAASYHAASVGAKGPGRDLLVYHLAAGMFEASLLRRRDGYVLVATRALDDVGGVDLDDALSRIVATAVPPDAAGAWQRLVTPTGTAEQRRFGQWCEDVQAAKEALSRQLTVGLHIPLVDRDVEIGRAAFESAAEPVLAPTVELTAGLLADAGTEPGQVGEVLLLGGSSRMPLVTTLLRRRLGLPVTACAQPELAVAEGALLATIAADPVPPVPVVPAGPRAPVDERPTRELPVLPGAPVTVPVAVPVARRRPVRLLVAATGLVCAVVLAGLVTARHPRHEAAGSEGHAAGTTAGAAGSAAGVPSLRAPSRTAAGVAPGAAPSAVSASASASVSASAVPSSAPPTSPTPSGGTAPVTVSVIANPPVATCATDVTFIAHFTVNQTGKYRWHWVFGGPNGFSFTGGDQPLDRTGDAHLTRKFSPGGSYWGQVQITSPVSVASDRTEVQVTCAH